MTGTGQIAATTNAVPKSKVKSATDLVRKSIKKKKDDENDETDKEKRPS